MLPLRMHLLVAVPVCLRPMPGTLLLVVHVRRQPVLVVQLRLQRPPVRVITRRGVAALPSNVLLLLQHMLPLRMHLLVAVPVCLRPMPGTLLLVHVWPDFRPRREARGGGTESRSGSWVTHEQRRRR